ncbi:MAG: outer membrane lipoprotein carrier protein LolA [Isosphaeraceae bacterium]|nr:outer membrane lipoprotein carrier protein LolA [Isosphaeraceae bacterium]
MPTNRFVPAVAVGLFLPLWAWAQAPIQNPLPGSQPPSAADPAKKAEEPPTEAEKVIDAAIAKLQALDSLSADLTQRVDLLREKFEITGNFLKAKGDLIRLELTVVAPAESASKMLQVCDGKILWDYDQVLDSQRYRKLDIAKVRKKLEDPVIDAALREQVLMQVGFSGPEALLTGMRKSVRFNQKADGELDGRKVWVVRGQWKSVQGLLGPNQQPLSPTAPLPAYIPSNIALHIDQESGFPLKVEMIGNAPSLLQEDTRRIGVDGRPIGAKTSMPKIEPSRITLTYTNLKINPVLQPEEFAFQAPPDAKGLVDGTDELMTFLDSVIQAETARRRADAAKGDPLVGGSIDIPKTAPEPAGTPNPSSTNPPPLPGSPALPPLSGTPK